MMPATERNVYTNTKNRDAEQYITETWPRGGLLTGISGDVCGTLVVEIYVSIILR